MKTSPPSSPPFPLLGHDSPPSWSSGEKRRRLAWILVSRTLFRCSLPGWFRWRNALLRLFGARIDDHPAAPARVWPDVDIYFPWKLHLESGSLIGPGCRIYNLDTVQVNAGANLSRHVHVCAGSHDFTQWRMPLVTAPVKIGRNAWIATEVFIGPGVSIGEEAVVGARSVVVRDQPAGMFCAGNPCKPKHPRPPLK